jgi:hypothetical protein
LKAKIEELQRASMGRRGVRFKDRLRDPVGHYDLPHSDSTPGHFDVAHLDGSHGDRVHLDGYGDSGHDDAFHDDRPPAHTDATHDDAHEDHGGHDDSHADGGGHDDAHSDGGGHEDAHDDGGGHEDGHEDDGDFWDRIDWLMHEMEIVLSVLEKGVTETFERRLSQAFRETNDKIEQLSTRISRLEGRGGHER